MKKFLAENIMNDYKKQTIVLDDLLLEIHHNPTIKNKPYHFRVCGYDGYTTHRLGQDDILKLSEALADFVFDNSSTIDYNDSLTGLARLWHHRRNEAIKELEKYTND